MLRSSQSKVHGAANSITRAPSRSHARVASSKPIATRGSIGVSSGLSVSAIVIPSNGRGPGRRVRGSCGSGTGGGITGSGSAPPAAIACSSAAQSAIVRAIGPGWSSELASGITPPRGMRPWVGLIALVPQHAEGIRNDPHVSLPSAAGVIRAASAAALPPLDPPATRSSSNGLPTWSVVPPAANSWVCVWPSRTMPSSRRRLYAIASRSATLPSSTRLEAVSGSPATPYRSFTASGIPHSSGASAPSRARRSSAARACSRARSGYSRTHALIASGAPSWLGAPPLLSSIRCRHASVSSSALSCPSRSCSAACNTPRSAGPPGPSLFAPVDISADPSGQRLVRGDYASTGVARSVCGRITTLATCGSTWDVKRRYIRRFAPNVPRKAFSARSARLPVVCCTQPAAAAKVSGVAGSRALARPPRTETGQRSPEPAPRPMAARTPASRRRPPAAPRTESSREPSC